jgi:uncharacterized protein (DUF1501 family)
MASRLALASAPTDARFVFVLLRGALDGLSAVPPVGDPDYAGLRGPIALAKSGEGAALPLEGPFALHPALRFLHQSYAAKELAILHAVASPYRERSHFDAQNVLESGDLRPQGSTSGWMNRALTALPAGKSREAGVALGANVPLAMRGSAEVASWSPTKTAALDESTLARLTDLYARDPLLSRRLADALELALGHEQPQQPSLAASKIQHAARIAGAQLLDNGGQSLIVQAGAWLGDRRCRHVIVGLRTNLIVEQSLERGAHERTALEIAPGD